MAVVLLTLTRKANRVGAQLLDDTNGYRLVIVRNPTAKPYQVTAWGEFYANEAWERLSPSNTFLKVEPASFIEAGILMPTNRPRRIALVYRAVMTSGPGYWISRARARLRLKPQVEREYIEVE